MVLAFLSPCIMKIQNKQKTPAATLPFSRNDSMVTGANFPPGKLSAGRQ